MTSRATPTAAAATSPRRPRAPSRSRALDALGITSESVAAAPLCTPFFATIGGTDLVLRALRASPIPEARAFLARYDDPTLNPNYRSILPLEAFCVAASVCPSRLAEVAVEAIAKQELLHGAVLAAVSHPQIMKANIRVAQTDEGIPDRLAHFKMSGAMPAAKGSRTVVNVNASASADSRAASLSASASAPSPEDTIRRIVEARQQRAALIAGRDQPALPAAPPAAGIAFAPKPREMVTIDIPSDEPDSDDLLALEDS